MSTLIIVERHTAKIGLLSFLIMATPTLGCDAITKLRYMFHPDEAGRAGLRVEVTPKKNLTILLDKKKVGSKSPCVLKTLLAGNHLLEVRSMGYYPFLLSVELRNDQTLTIPVVLRAHPPKVKASVEVQASTSKVSRAPPKDPTKFALPPELDPIGILIKPEPPVPVLLDSKPINGRKAVINRLSGELNIGLMKLAYRVNSNGTLVLLIAKDNASWFLNARPIKNGSYFQLVRGAARIRRVGQNGTDQTALLSR